MPSSGLPFSARDSALATASSSFLSANAGAAASITARIEIDFLIG